MELKNKWAKRFLKPTITHYFLGDHLTMISRKCVGFKHPCWRMAGLTLTLSMSKDYHDVNLGGSYGCGVVPGQGIQAAIHRGKNRLQDKLQPGQALLGILPMWFWW
jgi:hypothetical protein